MTTTTNHVTVFDVKAKAKKVAVQFLIDNARKHRSR